MCQVDIVTLVQYCSALAPHDDTTQKTWCIAHGLILPIILLPLPLDKPKQPSSFSPSETFRHQQLFLTDRGPDLARILNLALTSQLAFVRHAIDPKLQLSLAALPQGAGAFALSRSRG